MNNFLKDLKENKNSAILCIVLGFAIQFLILIFDHIINNHPNGVPLAVNLLYLITSRPAYIIGFSLISMPILIGNPITQPLHSLLSHRYWAPHARLIFGVYLSNDIFMQYRIFNLEDGIWAESWDTFLLFAAFLLGSFIFSFITYIFIEAPFANLLTEFLKARSAKERAASVFYVSQSAKAPLRAAKSKKQTRSKSAGKAIASSFTFDKPQDK